MAEKQSIVFEHYIYYAVRFWPISMMLTIKWPWRSDHDVVTCGTRAHRTHQDISAPYL